MRSFLIFLAWIAALGALYAALMVPNARGVFLGRGGKYRP